MNDHLFAKELLIRFTMRDFEKVYQSVCVLLFLFMSGWSGGAMVLGKLPEPGGPTYLDHSRARAYYACSGCGWGLFGHFFSRLSFLFSVSLSLGDSPI